MYVHPVAPASTCPLVLGPTVADCERNTHFLFVYLVLTLLLSKVESAVETRTVDRQLLMRVATARITIAFVRRIVNHVKSRCSMLLDQRIKAHYSGHIFEAYARLDVPTFDDPMVQRQLETAAGGRSTVAWNTVQVITNSVSTVISLVSQLSVLYGVLEGQRDGRMIALVSFISPMLSWMRINEFGFKGGMSLPMHMVYSKLNTSFSLGCDLSG